MDQNNLGMYFQQLFTDFDNRLQVANLLLGILSELVITPEETDVTEVIDRYATNFYLNAREMNKFIGNFNYGNLNELEKDIENIDFTITEEDQKHIDRIKNELYKIMYLFADRDNIKENIKAMKTAIIKQAKDSISSKNIIIADKKQMPKKPLF